MEKYGDHFNTIEFHIAADTESWWEEEGSVQYEMLGPYHYNNDQVSGGVGAGTGIE